MATFKVSLQRFEICALPTEQELKHAPDAPASSVYAGRLPEDMWVISAYFETANEDGFARALATALVEQDTPDEFGSFEDFTSWASHHCLEHIRNLISQQVRTQMVTFDLSLDIPHDMLNVEIQAMVPAAEEEPEVAKNN